MKAFLEALASAIEPHASDMSTVLAEALRSADPTILQVPCEPPATGEVLDRLFTGTNSDAHPLLQEIARLRDRLFWYSPAFERIPEPISSRLSVVEILGPDGLVHCGDVRAGLFLQMPNLYYPAHRHDADELYLVVSGTAEWQLDGSEFRAWPPGSLIHHPSGHWHAMNTGSDPLLAVWGWSGDIRFESYDM